MDLEPSPAAGARGLGLGLGFAGQRAFCCSEWCRSVSGCPAGHARVQSTARLVPGAPSHVLIHPLPYSCRQPYGASQRRLCSLAAPPYLFFLLGQSGLRCHSIQTHKTWCVQSCMSDGMQELLPSWPAGSPAGSS